MSDMTPQAVFGFDEKQIRDLIRQVRDEDAARPKGPGRIAMAAGYIVDRLKEPTSYAGLAIIAIPVLNRLGISVSDDQWGAIMGIAVGAAGLAAFMLRERGGTPAEQGQ
jgi:hypothetical protein